MRLLHELSLARWSARKLRLPIKTGDLVLDVGAGGNPLPRADVLLERYLGGQHRHGVAAVTDRPTVFADARKMPFRDKAFDYVVAFHVLEHITDPGAFLRELSRVAKAGYVETPNVLFERLIPYDVHCLEIMDIDGRLLIRKKSAPVTDGFLRDLQLVPRSPSWSRLFADRPQLFHVQHFWTGNIEFTVVNPEEPCDWYASMTSDQGQEPSTDGSSPGLRGVIARHLRRRYSRKASRVDLATLLVCPSCKGRLDTVGDVFSCPRCGVQYPTRPWPVFV